MMISPGYYSSEHMNDTYAELVKARDELIEYVKAFENGETPEEDYKYVPSPSTVYTMNLRYLSEICQLISDKYIEENDYIENIRRDFTLG